MRRSTALASKLSGLFTTSQPRYCRGPHMSPCNGRRAGRSHPRCSKMATLTGSFTEQQFGSCSSPRCIFSLHLDLFFSLRGSVVGGGSKIQFSAVLLAAPRVATALLAELYTHLYAQARWIWHHCPGAYLWRSCTHTYTHKRDGFGTNPLVALLPAYGGHLRSTSTTQCWLTGWGLRAPHASRPSPLA